MSAVAIAAKTAEARTLSVQEAARVALAAHELGAQAAEAGTWSTMPAGVAQELAQLGRELEARVGRLTVLLQRVAT